MRHLHYFKILPRQDLNLSQEVLNKVRFERVAQEHANEPVFTTLNDVSFSACEFVRAAPA